MKTKLSFHKIGVIPANGIGDSLIMHMVSYLLQSKGVEVTTFSNHLHSFGPWLEGYQFALQPKLAEIETTFSRFDALFLQHDNTEKAYAIKRLDLPIYTLYGSYKPSKHGPFDHKYDFVCNPQQTMVFNTMSAMAHFFSDQTEKTGLKPPPDLVYENHPKRIAIHPTSASQEKNWPKEKFLNLANQLAIKGYEPVFTVSPSERSEWNSPLFPTLGDLTSFLYQSHAFIGNDSGLGHIASYLQIPHLIIGQDPKQLRLWRPGWGRGAIVTLPPFLAYWNICKKNWKSIISEKEVIKKLKFMQI
jgi:hypothetical protein